MKGLTKWNYKPFTHLTDMESRNLPVVCRVAPGPCRFEFEWYDNGSDGAHAVRYRPEGSAEWAVKAIESPVVMVDGLKDLTDYEFVVYRTEGKGESQLKYARTGFLPGTVINYIHPKEREINPLGYCPSSPTICRLPSGAILSGHDIWAPAKPSNVAQLFKSIDEGKTWRYVTDLCPCLWPELFVHRGKLYALSCTMEYGDLQISCSEDEGETWSKPVVIMAGGGFTEIGPHKAPVPVVEHNGRLYTAIEFGAWKIKDHQSTMLSIDADADLMQAENWQFGPFVQMNRSWPGAPEGIKGGYIEGNVVVGPDGCVYNMLRLDYPGTGKACLLKGNPEDPEAPQEFVAIIDCPVGANSKFETHRDPVTGKYIAIGTEQVDDVKNEDGNTHPNQRLVLSMAVSDDLLNWKVVHRLFDYREEDVKKVGFQYPDWIFSGDDIYVQTRTAFNGADTFHNGNCEIFSVIENYKQYL